MDTTKAEDTAHFGEDTIVYCSQHLRPHRTGWCTVNVANKIALEAQTIELAYDECIRKGLKLYGDVQP